MKTIKTSKSATHYCRLQTSGALKNACNMQCGDCKEKVKNSMKHNSAIKVLMAHSQKLNEALKVQEDIIENPEMTSDYIFAQNSAQNIEMEMNAIHDSIDELRRI